MIFVFKLKIKGYQMKKFSRVQNYISFSINKRKQKKKTASSQGSLII